MLAALDGKAMAATGEFSMKSTKGFLEANAAKPLDANAVFAAGMAEAEKSKRKVFVYLSAPW